MAALPEPPSAHNGFVLREILKNKLACFGTCVSAQVAWPAMHWRAIANLFLSHGDSDSELHNLSTQLAKFPLAGCYHANPMLQIPHGLCGAHQTNPRFASIPISLESSQAAA